ncbi:DUF5677 domain-containing protein [Actinomadura sp. NPDC023710]|uniref:DUF5677 domain-containing protein n=1 Tax=Actinomadura sp. NPDC023710 TaxID=3158219 RepID=UPI0033DA30A5
MTYTFGNNPGTRRRALPIAKTLMAEAEALTVRGLDVLEEDLPLVRVLAGWWMHVNALAADFVKLVEGGSTIQTVPGYRSMAEHVYKMIWLARAGDDGLKVLSFNTWNKRRLMIEELGESWELLDDVEVGPVPDIDIRALRSVKDDPVEGRLYRLWNQFEQFNKLTASFGHADMYTAYRLMCNYSHPTASTADAYTEASGDGTFAIRVKPKPLGGGDPEILHLPILLMQAGLVVSGKLQGDPFRRGVDKAARDYGIKVADLLPTT